MPGIDPKTKQNMNLNTTEGAFAVASDNLTVPYLGLFALSLGATPSQIGMLNAFPALIGNLLQVPYGILANKVKDRRVLITIGALINRFSWILMVFLPFWVKPELGIPLLIFLATMRVVGANIGVPAWTSIQAEIIPKSARGRYYANRNIFLNSAGLVATLVASRVLSFSYPGNFRSLFVIAWALGMVSLFIFLRIDVQRIAVKKKGPRTTKRSLSLKPALVVIRANRNFAYYCLASFVWGIGVNVVNPMISVYYIQDLMGTAQYWAYVQAAGIIAGILCQRYWGLLTDRFGQKNIMHKAGIGAVLIPLLWFFASSALVGIFINFWGGFMWGGYNLAAFNFLLEITPDESRSMYVGVYNSLMGIAAAIGPLSGGFLAEVIGLRYLFLLSFVGRIVGLLLLYFTVDNSSEQSMSFRDLVYPLQNR